MAEQTAQAASPKIVFERERGVYALEVLHDIAHAVVSTGDDVLRASRQIHIFRTLTDADVPIFLVKMHRTVVTFALAGSDLAKAQEALEAANFKATTRRDLALIAVRAASMRDLHGVMVEIADSIAEAGARLYETGDSHNSVQCLIDGDRAAASLATLREKFHLDANAVKESHFEEERAA